MLSQHLFYLLTDINECASDSAVCEHDALCVNLPGSYACQCKLGYQITDNACQGKQCFIKRVRTNLYIYEYWNGMSVVKLYILRIEVEYFI